MAPGEKIEDEIKEVAEGVVTKALEPLGGNLVRGWILAVAFAFVVGNFTVTIASQYAFMVPQIILMLGAMAVSIAVQQAYLSSASGNGGEDNDEAITIYFWGALALIFLGLAAITEGLSHGQFKTKFSTSLVDLISIPLFCLGLVALYRFIALYFLRESKPDFVERKNPLTIFNTNAPKLMVVDTGLAIVAVVYALLVLIHSKWDLINESTFLPDPLLMLGAGAQDIYGFNVMTASIALLFLLSSYSMALYFYIPGIKQIYAGSENESTIRFFQGMVKWFYIPTIAQAIMLIALCFSPSQIDDLTGEVIFSNDPLRALGAVGLLLFVVSLLVFSFVKSPQLKSICRFMIFPMLIIGAMCFIARDLFLSAPIPYLMLGFLTLGFAYLPASDLIRLRRQA